MLELADGILELTLTRMVLVIRQSDRAGVECREVCPPRAAGRTEKRIKLGTGLPHANHDSALHRVGAEASPSVGGEERVIGHLLGHSSHAGQVPSRLKAGLADLLVAYASRYGQRTQQASVDQSTEVA